MLNWNKVDTMFFYREILQILSPKQQGNSASTVEIISLLQKREGPNLIFAKIVSNAFSTIEWARIKMKAPTYKVGDIVYLKNHEMLLNWRLSAMLKKPFIVIKLPENTKKFKTYTLRLLDDPSGEECWVDYNLHEDFLSGGKDA